MNYNDKLKQLIKDAADHGYKYQNGEFIKNPDDFTPVMEVFLQTHSTYESSGYYYIYKHTFVITEEELEKMLIYAKSLNKTIDFETELNDVLYDDIILKYLISDKNCNINLDLFNEEEGQVLIQSNTYNVYELQKDKCADFFFSCKNDEYQNNAFPTGYISFYKMLEKDFEKMENVNLTLHKFMRDNFNRVYEK